MAISHIGQAITNDIGRAEFIIPEDVIGDEEGYISIVVSLDENYEAQEVALEKALVGKPKEVPRLIQPEVLWSTNENVSTMVAPFIHSGSRWSMVGHRICHISDY